MPFNESYEQTPIMRDAFEIVMRLAKDGAERRDEIAKMIVTIATAMTLDATALANLTLSELKQSARKQESMG